MKKEDLLSDIKNNSFCSYPFTNIRNGMSHGYTPCCWMQTQQLVGPANTTPFDYYDGPEAKELRRAMLAGEMSEYVKAMCQRCFYKEKHFGTSPRLMNELYDPKILDHYAEDGSYTGTARNLNLELNFYGNTCNLECYGCHSGDSTTRDRRLEQLADLDKRYPRTNKFPDTDLLKIDQAQFSDIISDILDNADRIKSISFCGGEPMLMKSHFRVLDALAGSGKSRSISLSYVSNMTIFTLKQMQKYLDRFNYTHIQWSCDGLGDRNYYLRYPTNWEQTLSHVDEIREYFLRTGKGSIAGTYTPSVLSVYKIKEVFEFFEKRGLKKRPFQIYNNLENPDYLRVNNLPHPIKEEIYDDVKSVDESVAKQMMQSPITNGWIKAKKYFDDLDSLRNTNWRQTFPELAGY